MIRVLEIFVQWIYQLPLWMVCAALLIALIVWTLAAAYMRKEPPRYQKWRLLNTVLAMFSIVGAVMLTLFARRDLRAAYLILQPFFFVLRDPGNAENYRTLIMNALLFFPIGLTLPFAIERRGDRRRAVLLTIAAACVMSVVLEALQFGLHLGVAETDDLIANTAGAAVGSLAIWLSRDRNECGDIGRHTHKRARIGGSLAALLLLFVLLIAAFIQGEPESAVYEGEGNYRETSGYADLSTCPLVDMTGYRLLDQEELKAQFADVTVRDIAALMDDHQTFVLIAAFDRCPGCNLAMPCVCDIAREADVTIAYLNTRKDPSWENNTQIDDYDLFVERFGEHLVDDEEGKPHLYTPHIFFIRDGVVVCDIPDMLAGVQNPTDSLSRWQKKELRERLREGFRALMTE